MLVGGGVKRQCHFSLSWDGGGDVGGRVFCSVVRTREGRKEGMNEGWARTVRCGGWDGLSEEGKARRMKGMNGWSGALNLKRFMIAKRSVNE